MALAWNAGWVNSPQGFKSPILRTGPGCDPMSGRTPDIKTPKDPEEWVWAGAPRFQCIWHCP